MDTDLRLKPALDQAIYQYSVLTADEQLELIDAVVRSGTLSAIGGQHVHDLEARVAHQLGWRGAVATASATAGLELALRCLPIRRPGWAVLVPEVCWASVATAVHHSGGTVHIAPVTADLTPHWEQIEPLLTPTITAVVLAHLRGRPAPDTARIAAEPARTRHDPHRGLRPSLGRHRGRPPRRQLRHGRRVLHREMETHRHRRRRHPRCRRS